MDCPVCHAPMKRWRKTYRVKPLMKGWYCTAGCLYCDRCGDVVQGKCTCQTDRAAEAPCSTPPMHIVLVGAIARAKEAYTRFCEVIDSFDALQFPTKAEWLKVKIALGPVILTMDVLVELFDISDLEAAEKRRIIKEVTVADDGIPF